MPVPGGGNVSGSGFPPYPTNSQYSGGSNVYPPYPTTASSGFPYLGSNAGSYGSYAGNTPGYPTQGYTGSYPPYPPSTQPVFYNHLSWSTYRWLGSFMLYVHSRHVILNFELKIIFGFAQTLKLSFVKIMNCEYFDILEKFYLKMCEAVGKQKSSTWFKAAGGHTTFVNLGITGYGII